MDKCSLGDVIRARRLNLQLTQEQLVKRLVLLGDVRVRQSDISRIEHGQVQLPRRDRLQRLAQALEMTLGELLAGAGWLDNSEDPAATSSERTIQSSPDDPPMHSNGTSNGNGGSGKQLHTIVENVNTNQSQFSRNQAEFARMRRLFEETRREFEESVHSRSRTDTR